ELAERLPLGGVLEGVLARGAHAAREPRGVEDLLARDDLEDVAPRLAAARELVRGRDLEPVELERRVERRLEPERAVALADLHGRGPPLDGEEREVLPRIAVVERRVAREDDRELGRVGAEDVLLLAREDVAVALLLGDGRDRVGREAEGPL